MMAGDPTDIARAFAPQPKAEPDVDRQILIRLDRIIDLLVVMQANSQTVTGLLVAAKAEHEQAVRRR